MTNRTNAQVIYLAEIVVYDATIPGTRTLRYTSGAGFMTTPSDTPASTLYDARLLQPALVSRHLFANGTTAGHTQLATGDLVLINGDGGLDALLTYGFDGRAVTLKQGAPDGTFASFTTVGVYTMDQAEVSTDLVTIRLHDRQLETDVALQATKYAGTNALPAGMEGVTDQKGKPKPVLYGTVLNIAPPCVNTSKLAYQVNDAAVNAISAVYDQGAALIFGADYASQAAFEAAATAAGHYDTWLAGGCFRLGGTPVGPVTCDAQQGANVAARTTAQVWKNILVRLGKSSGDYSAADITALDSAAGYELGAYWDSETVATDALDAVAGSVGAWWGINNAGVFRIKQFVAPTGSNVVSLVADDLLKPLNRVATKDQGAGIPIYRAIVRYAKNYTVQTTGLAAGVTAVRRPVLAADYLDATYTDASVQTAHLLAPQTVEESFLTTAADALAEATRRQVLRGTRRDQFELLLRYTDVNAAVDLGDTLLLTHSRYSLTGGKQFRVIGIEPNAKDATVLLTVWG